MLDWKSVRLEEYNFIVCIGSIIFGIFSVQSQILKSNISISNRQFGVSFVKQKFHVHLFSCFLDFSKRDSTQKKMRICVLLVTLSHSLRRRILSSRTKL